MEKIIMLHTFCSGGLDKFYIVGYYIKWVKTSRTYSSLQLNAIAYYNSVKRQ